MLTCSQAEKLYCRGTAADVQTYRQMMNNRLDVVFIPDSCTWNVLATNHMLQVVQVTYMKTDYLEDQVLLSGFAAGGLSDVPLKAFRSASLGCMLAQELGQFGYKPEVCFLRKARHYITHLCVRVSGSIANFNIVPVH